MRTFPGWRKLGEDEVCMAGDAFAHESPLHDRHDPSKNPKMEWNGYSVKHAISAGHWLGSPWSVWRKIDGPIPVRRLLSNKFYAKPLPLP